jgi:hypothetical protein
VSQCPAGTDRSYGNAPPALGKLWGNASQKELGHTVPPQEKDGKGLIMFHDSCRNSLFYLVEESCGVAIYIYTD